MYLERPHRRQPSLKPFLEYRESEKHCETRAACSRAGELLEYETLALRVVPPNIEIENNDSENITRVTVDSANRPGTLVEVRSRSLAVPGTGCLWICWCWVTPARLSGRRSTCVVQAARTTL